MSNLGSLTTFSSSGKLKQLDNALAAVQQGKPSLGVRTKNGAVLITDRMLPNQRMIPKTAQKVEKICSTIGMTYAGIKPDFRQLVRLARKKAGAYFLQYGENIPVKQLAQIIGEEAQSATQRGGVRPYGASVLIIGYDHMGPQLFQVDPSGASYSWKGSAVGSKAGSQKTFIEKRYDEDMDLSDAVHCALLTMKEGFEGEMRADTIEIGVAELVTNEKGEKVPTFHVLTQDEVQDYMDQLS